MVRSRFRISGGNCIIVRDSGIEVSIHRASLGAVVPYFPMVNRSASSAVLWSGASRITRISLVTGLLSSTLGTLAAAFYWR